LDIYQAVATEATIAGDWYYGTVSLEDVARYLDSAEKAGMTRVTTAPLKKTPTGTAKGSTANDRYGK